MRYHFAASILAAGAMAQSATDYLKCTSAALSAADTSSFEGCDGKSAQECLCDNKDAISKLSDEAADACAGVDLTALTGALCSSSRETTPARHASKPMQLADPHERAFAPQVESSPASAGLAAPRVVYVTETKTDCSCKSTPAPNAHFAHVSQIPVDVPASSSSYMAGMAAASTPAGYSHGLMGSATSSVIFGSQASAATPLPSGVDPSRFSTFQGAAAPGVSVHGVAAAGVAAVMALMVAL